LGLAVVHGIVKSHQGAITVYSVPGKGTTFNIYLPILEEKAAPAVEPPIALPKGEGTVLLVEDEERLAELGRKMLEHLGYEVVVRINSIEALSTFRSQPAKFDVVITDYTMPQMTGTQLAKKMLDIRPDIPIILCTGFSEVILAEKAKDIGIKEFLMKPLSISDLAQAVQRLLAKKQ
jgi:two-component system, cell cycle sensor histidine kinase and response regulator CckA